MKKLMLAVLIIMLVGGLCFSQEYDIRKLKWGMSYDDVKRIEGLDDTLYKGETLQDVNVEVVFGVGKKGLHSVIYSSKDLAFAQMAAAVLSRKYGDSGKGMDYAFLVEAQEILKRYPKAVVELLEDKDYSALNLVGQSSTQHQKIIKGGLAKRQMWEYGTTVVLLLDSGTEGGVLSYRYKNIHQESEVKFGALLKELKGMVKQKQKKQASETDENF